MSDTREGAEAVGARLRAAREEQGQSLDDIGRATRVPVRHLLQIEEGRLEGLPAAPYSAGFVKSYARAVGLDPVALSQEFRAEYDKVKRGSGYQPYEPYEPADPSRLPPRLLALVALAIAIVLVAGYAIWRSGVLTGQGPDARARLAANGAPETTSTATTSTAASVAAPAPAPAAGGPVVLTATAPVWMKVSERNGATLFIGTLDQGKSYPVPATAADPVIRTGKPEGLAVTVGGRPVAPLGLPAHTVSNVSLKGDALLARGSGGAPAPAVGAVSDAPRPVIDAAPSPAAPAADGTPSAFVNSMAH